ncbi:MAG: DNRLRE domain-containing protein [Alphaproteobacteria bacterium]|nr:DNRLRE domain-containing protein [Alphaproteobacteria bacterium]
MKALFLTLVFTGFFLLTFGGGVKTIIIQPGPTNGYDAYINSAYPYEPGPTKGMLVTAWTLGGMPYLGNSLIRFDLSELKPTDSILDARLSLFFDPQGSWPEHSGLNQAHIYKIIEFWDVNSVNWMNQPSYISTGSIMLCASTNPQQNYTNINIKEFVKSWKSNPDQNFGFMICLDETIPYANLVFAPSESIFPDLRPKLVITIYTDCTRPVAGFVNSINNTTVNFQDTTSSPSTFSWLWEFGDGYLSTLQNPFHTYSKEGIYNVCLTVEDSCGRDSICKQLHICDLPQTYFHYKISDSLKVTFTDSSYHPLSWWWDFGDGFYSELQNPVHIYNQVGTYKVCETVENECGIEQFCDTIEVKLTGTQEQNLTEFFNLFPNPANDYINVKWISDNAITIKFEIFNLLGDQIMTKTVFSKQGDNIELFDLSEYCNGVYILRISTDRRSLIRSFTVL